METFFVSYKLRFKITDVLSFFCLFRDLTISYHTGYTCGQSTLEQARIEMCIFCASSLFSMQLLKNVFVYEGLAVLGYGILVQRRYASWQFIETIKDPNVQWSTNLSLSALYAQMIFRC